ALFVVDVSTRSGSARSGTVENGHYYLRERHGRRKEVSPGFWKYRWWHETSLLVTHPLAMASMMVAYLYASRIRRRRRRQSPPVLSRQVSRISTAFFVQTAQWPSNRPTMRRSTVRWPTLTRKGVTRSRTMLSSLPV